MTEKAKRIWLIILTIMFLPLLVAFFEPFLRNIFQGDKNGYYLIGFGLLYLLAIVIGFGVYSIIHFSRKFGPKGVFIGLLITVVLVPLAFLGTCLPFYLGDYVRTLFLK